MDIQRINHMLVKAIGGLQEGELGAMAEPLEEARAPNTKLLVNAIETIEKTIDTMLTRAPKLNLWPKGKEFKKRLQKELEEISFELDKAEKRIVELGKKEPLTKEDLLDWMGYDVEPSSYSARMAAEKIKKFQDEISRSARHDNEKYGAGDLARDLEYYAKDFFRLDAKKIVSQIKRASNALMKRMQR